MKIFCDSIKFIFETNMEIISEEAKNDKDPLSVKLIGTNAAGERKEEVILVGGESKERFIKLYNP